MLTPPPLLAGNFFYMIMTNWLLGLTSNSVGVALGSAVANPKTATELTPLIFVPQLLFSGFFISIDGTLSYDLFMLPLIYSNSLTPFCSLHLLSLLLFLLLLLPSSAIPVFLRWARYLCSLACKCDCYTCLFACACLSRNKKCLSYALAARWTFPRILCICLLSHSLSLS